MPGGGGCAWLKYRLHSSILRGVGAFQEVEVGLLARRVGGRQEDGGAATAAEAVAERDGGEGFGARGLAVWVVLDTVRIGS